MFNDYNKYYKYISYCSASFIRLRSKKLYTVKVFAIRKEI